MLSEIQILGEGGGVGGGLSEIDNSLWVTSPI